jgi:hypothetical protein
MEDAMAAHLEILDGYPADVLAIRATGEVRREDYEQVLIPAVKAMVGAEGRVKLLYILGPQFAGITAGAMWDDAKLGLLHMGDFARVAVVTDVDWIRAAMKIFAPLTRSPVHVFPMSELAAAKVWIDENGAPKAAHKPGVDVTHKLPLTEDKMREDP